MADIQPATPALTASASVLPTASTPLTSIQVTIGTVPAALETLTRTIQTGATLTNTQDTNTNGNTLTLATALGTITVTLAQQLSVADKQNLTQQFLHLIDTQRPLTLTLQPGSPPSQGALLIPTTLQQSNASAPTLPQGLAQNIPSPLLQPLVAGQTLPALVLPTSSVLPSLTNNNAAQNQPILASTVPLPQIPLTPQATLNAQIATQAYAHVSPAPVPTAVTASGIASAALPPDSPLVATSPAIAPPLSPAEAMAQTTGVQNIPVSSLAPASPPAQLATLLTPGTELTVHIDAVSTQAIAPNNIPPFPIPPPNQIQATVTGTGNNGQLLLKTSDTTLFIKAPVTAAVGTTVTLTLGISKTEPLMPLPLSTAASALPSLQPVAQALAQISPPLFQHMMASSLPQPNEQLPGALMLLFGSFKKGNAGAWLGDDVSDALYRAGKGDLITALSRDLGQAGQTAQDPVVGDWRSYPLPLYAQQQFQALTLYVHQDRNARQQSSGTGGNGKMRFVIDMRLSRLGAMQIDGFVQPKKLDMILRSENLLPDGTHDPLRLAYIKALEAVGFSGTLSFQVGRQHWLTMRQNASQGMMS